MWVCRKHVCVGWVWVWVLVRVRVRVSSFPFEALVFVLQYSTRRTSKPRLPYPLLGSSTGRQQSVWLHPHLLVGVTKGAGCQRD